MKENLLAQEAPEGIYNPALSPLVGRGKGIEIINLILGNILSVIFVLGVVLAFFFIVIGGVQWITAGDDKVKMEAARGRIASALIGLVVLLAVFAIMKLIGAFFGIEQLNKLLFDISPYLIEYK